MRRRGGRRRAPAGRAVPPGRRPRGRGGRRAGGLRLAPGSQLLWRDLLRSEYDGPGERGGGRGRRRDGRRTGRPWRPASRPRPTRWSTSCCRRNGPRRADPVPTGDSLVGARMSPCLNRPPAPPPPATRCTGHPRCCCTTTSTAGCGPQTVLDLAPGAGHELPADDAESLGRWFEESANSGSLERYLETFDHTVAVMQSRRGPAPGGAECVEDLADDGVVYAEVRYAPEQHLEGGLSLEQVVDAVAGRLRGGGAGARPSGRADHRAAAADRDAAPGAVAWRSPSSPSRYRDRGVLGFDIAGAEAGFPPTRHLDAFEYLQRENAHFTIHAGEAFGLPSIWQAIQWCGADRLGHGVRIIDDITVGPRRRGRRSAGWRRTSATSGSRSRCARGRTCRPAPPTSIAEHPIGLLKELGFRVTVNTDNRLMSGTSMSRGDGRRWSRRSATAWPTCAGSRSTR